MPDEQNNEHPIDRANRILFERMCIEDGIDPKGGVSRELREWAQRRQAPRLMPVSGEAA